MDSFGPGSIADADKLPAECWSLIIQHMDAANVVNAQLLSSFFNELGKSGAVWRALCELEFGLLGATPKHGDGDWKDIYSACHTALSQSIQSSRLYSSQVAAGAMAGRLERDQSQLAFGRELANSDHHGEYSSVFPASIALSHHRNPSICWCTSRGAHRNQSVAAPIVGTAPNTPLHDRHCTPLHAVVLAIGVINAPSEGFSNPAHEVLAFGSRRAPTNASPTGPVGAHLGGDERFEYHERSEQRSDQRSDQRSAQRSVGAGASHAGGSNAGGEGGGGRDGSSNPVGGRANAAESNAAESADDAALVRALLDDKGETALLRRAARGEPLAGVRFPAPPECGSLQIVQPVAPTVCKYIRFLIRTAHNPHRDADANVDLCRLQAFGVLVPELADLLGPEEDEVDANPIADPQRDGHLDHA